MRQPGNEFKIDPFKAIGTEEMPAPVLSGQFAKDHAHWVSNTSIARQHKFCATLCVNFKAAGGLGKDEQACMDTCFSKFGAAFSAFQEEKQHYLSSLADVALRGEDRYASREI